MIYINYIIKPSPLFERELINIYNYLRLNLHEPNVATKFYDTITYEISSLNQFPERYPKITNIHNRNYRKLPVLNYIIIYEVNQNTGQVFILNIFHSSQNYLNML